MCMLSGLSKCELHRGCQIAHEEHEERSHENTMQSITQELFFRLTNSENVPVQTWELSAANRYTTCSPNVASAHLSHHQAPRAQRLLHMTITPARCVWPV